MNNCGLCLDENQEPPDSTTMKRKVRVAIDIIFQAKIKIEPHSSYIVCKKCENIVLEFYDYYMQVLKNQAEYEKLVKFEESFGDGKEESFPIEYSECKTENVSSKEADKLPKARKRGRTIQKPEESKTNEDKIIKDFFGLVCKECDSCNFDKFGELREHMRNIHKIKKFALQCCSRSFYKRCYVLDHAMSHVNPEKLKCSVCGKQCINKRSFRFHLLKHQVGEKFQCELCSKTFHMKAGLKAHMKTHLSADEKKRLKIHICSSCGNGFAQKSLLAHHVRQTHENVYSCVCDICAKTFSTKIGFLTHFKHVHGKLEQNQVQCQICGKWSANDLSLKKHVRRNHEPGPHKCKTCGKEVKSLSTLLAHERYSHQATRKFQCEFCEKAFKRPLSLKEHLTRHLGGVLYTCTYCDRTFNSGANMYSHRKKIHPVEWERDRKN